MRKMSKTRTFRRLRKSLNCQFCYFASTINANAVIFGHERGCFTHIIFVDPGIKINGVYYRDVRGVLLKQEMLPDIRAISGDFTFQQDTAPTGPQGP